MHPTKGHPSHTLANGIMKYMHDTDQSFKIRFANRLDMDTSGIVIVAKNANSQNDISHQMRNQTTVKKYRAVVLGDIKEEFFTMTFLLAVRSRIRCNAASWRKAERMR